MAYFWPIVTVLCVIAGFPFLPEALKPKSASGRAAFIVFVIVIAAGWCIHEYYKPTPLTEAAYRNDQEQREQKREAALRRQEAEAKQTLARETAEKKKSADQQNIKEAHQRSCDFAAANPYDKNTPFGVQGVHSPISAADARSAVRECDKAIATSPGEVRFQYQRARALSYADPEKACAPYRSLIHARPGYAAALGDYGRMRLNGVCGPKSEAEAVALFQRGEWLEDPEATFALAIAHRKGLGGMVKSDDLYLELLQRASERGHIEAQKILEEARLAESERPREICTVTYQHKSQFPTKICKPVN